MQPRKWFIVAIGLFSLMPIHVSNVFAEEHYVTVYVGKYSDHKLGHVLVSKPVKFVPSHLGVVAWGKAISNPSNSYQWEVEGQLGKHWGEQSNWETNLALLYRWQRFPWNHQLRTSLAVGDGLSYAHKIPKLEAASRTNVGATRLLNYIVVEMTVAPAQVKKWDLVVRVHHRSGVYGLFNDVEGGSNIVAAGVKFRY